VSGGEQRAHRARVVGLLEVDHRRAVGAEQTRGAALNHDALVAALADSDVDQLRRQLRDMVAPVTPPASAPEDAGEPLDPAAVLTKQAVGIADHLLKLGLPHLERDAAAAQAEATTRPAIEWPLIDVPDLGLALRAQPVMGQAVWPAALALGKFLCGHRDMCTDTRVIELGAGAAAPGLVARAAGAAFLLATDGDETLVPLMAANCEANTGGDWSAAVLDWRDAAAVEREACGSWDMVLAADVLYTAGDLVPVARASRTLLRSNPHSRVLLACSAWFEGFQPTLVAVFQEEGLTLLSQCCSGLGTGSDATGSHVRDETAAVVLEFGFTGAALLAGGWVQKL